MLAAAGDVCFYEIQRRSVVRLGTEHLAEASTQRCSATLPSAAAQARHVLSLATTNYCRVTHSRRYHSL
jgi:hypothetical protein